jgi:hypothetical protein
VLFLSLLRVKLCQQSPFLSCERGRIGIKAS